MSEAKKQTCVEKFKEKYGIYYDDRVIGTAAPLLRHEYDFDEEIGYIQKKGS